MNNRRRGKKNFSSLRRCVESVCIETKDNNNSQ